MEEGSQSNRECGEWHFLADRFNQGPSHSPNRKHKKGETYTDTNGKTRTWKGSKPLTLRNGVLALKKLFRKNLETTGWKSEEPLSLKPYFEKIRSDKTLAPVFRYPEPLADAIQDPLHEGVGDFDFWLQSSEGFRTVIEWETGNISSSHRSLNKICLAF